MLDLFLAVRDFSLNLHWPTAIFMFFILPLGIFLGKTILQYLKEWGSYFVEGILYWLTRIFKHSVAGTLTLKRYCRLQLSGQSQFLHVPSTKDVKLNIDNVFINLTLEHKSTEEANYNHKTLLSLSNRIRVIGDPGSGKSSLIKRLFRDACRAGIRHPSKRRLPIIFELKSLSVPESIDEDELGKWFYEELKNQIEKTRVYKMRECLDSYGETSGLLLLLDGLDEVSTNHYPRIESAIKGLSEKLHRMSSQNAIVLTMRSQFHQEVKESFRESFGQALFIKPFSPTDIYEFLTRWPFGEKTEKNVSRIFKDLIDRPTLRDICSNPLVLSMYVAEDQFKGNLIAPDTRTEFYAKITSELIIRRRLHQTGTVSGRITLRQQREKILGTIAYTHLINSDQATNLLDWRKAVRVIEEIMKLGPGAGEENFREIAKETGLIVEERPGETFRFIHLTFCEYLGAFEAVQGQENGWSKLIQVHSDFQKHPQHQFRSRLSEVIPFACGLLPRVQRPKAMAEISELNNNLLLERCFLETKLYDHPSWQALTRSETQRLLETPEDQWDSLWLQELHLFSVVAKDARQCSMHDQTIMQVNINEFFQNLVRVQQKSLSVVLAAQATQDAVAVFQIAEQCNIDLPSKFPEIIISNSDQPPFFLTY